MDPDIDARLEALEREEEAAAQAQAQAADMDDDDEALDEGERETLDRIRERKKKLVAGVWGAGGVVCVGFGVGGGRERGAPVEDGQCQAGCSSQSTGAALAASSLPRPAREAALCQPRALQALLTRWSPPPIPRLAEHRRKKAAGNNAAPMPRAVDPERSRTKERMRSELGALGLDAGGLGAGRHARLPHCCLACACCRCCPGCACCGGPGSGPAGGTYACGT